MSTNYFPARHQAAWSALRPRRAALLTPLLLALSLVAWATPSQAQPRRDTPSTSRANDADLVWLKIIAFADAPIEGADVRVSVGRSEGRPVVEVRGATNDQGVFPVRVRRRPAFLRVTVSGGTSGDKPFPWQMTAHVDLADSARGIVVVNPATTLVSLVLDERPDLQVPGAEALVRQFLGLAPEHSLGMALRQSSGYRSPDFSPVALMAEAETLGGLDILHGLLVQEMLASPTARHRFPGQTLLQDVGTTIATSLAQGALKYAGGQGAGWVMQSTGLVMPDATAVGIASLQQALADLQSKVDQLSHQVAQLTQLVQSSATQTQYNTIVTPALALASQINGVSSDLTYLALACPALPGGSAARPPDAFCVNQKGSVFNELRDVTIQQAYVTEVGYVQDSPTVGFRGMLHLYSLWLGQSRAFFRPADSTKMQALYDYWDSVLTQAANLKVELLHANGAQDNAGGQVQLTDFLGNPELIPATTGTFQANQAANLRLLFPPVPAEVVISTRDRTMWSIKPWNQVGQFSYWPGTGCSVFAAPWISSTFYAPGLPYAGFTNWSQSPTLAQWQAAVALAPAGIEWRDWLTQQTQTSPDESPASQGFFNFTRYCAGGYGYWTSTYSNTRTYQYYYYMIPFTNAFETRPYDGLHYGVAWPVRWLQGNEQYYWYD